MGDTGKFDRYGGLVLLIFKIDDHPGDKGGDRKGTAVFVVCRSRWSHVGLSLD